jgi:hypothetical protein
MKKTFNTKTFGLLLLFLCLSFNSCKKSVAGPQGDAGTPGGQGNLKQSDRSFTIFPGSWTFNGGWYNCDVYCPEITSSVISSGEIKVYMQVNSQWWSLPYTVGDIFMEQTSETGTLHLKYSKIHGGPPPAPTQNVFRIVVSSPA